MRLALVAMPWSDHTRPAAVLGALGAYVRRASPSVDVEILHEYVRISGVLGFETYEAIAADCYRAGEPLYMAAFYPERRDEIAARFDAWAKARLSAPRPDVPAVLQNELEATAQRIADGQFDVVGMTTCFGQLFANLTLARRLRQLGSRARVVLGGSTLSARVGPSILREYGDLVDFIVQGEGERPLVALLDALARGEPPPDRGLLVPGRDLPPNGAPMWEVESLDDLPTPDLDAYVELAEELGIDWAVSLEGSRGCWWDRTKRTGDPKSTCYFCNLNTQWNGYREKSVERLVREIDEVTERYGNPRVYFLDNIMRSRGVEELALGIQGLAKDFELFYEMRANVTPYELVLLSEAGLVAAQFGIEGLSTPFLRRIGKGTRTIDNLQVMKVCRELGIRTGANLIIDFPGATDEEVTETVRTIERYALAYEPCSVSQFGLGVDSTVDTLRDEFGIRDVRNRESARVGLPEEVWRRLLLFDLEYDRSGQVDWAPVREACDRWRKRYEPGEPLLSYRDGGTFLRITDARAGFEIHTLRGLHRHVYLECMGIRHEEQLRSSVADARVPDEDLADVVAELEELDLVYREGRHLLSLAVAASAQAAKRRIRASHAAKRERRRLAIVDANAAPTDDAKRVGALSPGASPEEVPATRPRA